MPANDPARDDQTDRNLLFGILALQNGFVTREALLAAFAVWVADKGRRLGEVLREQGMLTPSQDEVLRALAEEHIKRHSNDPEQSLATVNAVDWFHEELRKLGDPQLEASLAAVAQPTPAVDPYATKIMPAIDWGALEGGLGQRFRVLRPHAKGALGEVFVAQDLELHREVALKQIQSQFADQPDYRSRFVQEAEITGRLEHPGIVPVYGLGKHADGRPYYAMRFIFGDSLATAIARFHEADSPDRDPGERTLELRKLLGRFIDVCEAIEYAHSRGILHRDLKPSNIMLGKYGETLVVDWGLAKPMGSGEPLSVTGEPPLQLSSDKPVRLSLMGKAIGTPAYMPPEQAAGRHDLIDARTDIYGLGAILFEILAGRPPHRGKDTPTVLRKIVRDETPHARQVLTSVAPALDAICYKAMAKKRSERYQKAADLVNDVQRWLGDQPVSCYYDQVADRIRRATKRSQTALRDLISSYNNLGDASLQFGRIDEARDYYQKAYEITQKLVDENPGDPQAQRDLSVSYDRLGNVLRQSGQITEALEQYQKELEISRKLAAAEPSNARSQRDLAISYSKLGNVLLQSGQVAEALEQYLQDLEISQNLAAADPRDAQAQRDLSVSYNNVGNVLQQSGQVPQALAQYRQGLEIREKLAAADPSDSQAQRDLSISYNKLGDVLLRSGQVAQAQKYFQVRFEISQKLAAADPSDVPAQLDLAVSYAKIGSVKQEQQQFEQAIESYGRGLTLLRSLKNQKKLAPGHQRWIPDIEQFISQCQKLQREPKP